MRKLVFATNNAHKLEEVKEVLGKRFEIISLKELGCFDDIPETAPTLEGNALIKAQYIYDKYGYDCLSDDTGLEVEALRGEPGVYSARYAGDAHDAQANMNKLLENMAIHENRKACFRTVIALIEGGDVRYFEGRVDGTIAHEKKGLQGFGYDPIFIPEGYHLSFAELGSDIKNRISHRALAVMKMADYFESK